MKHHFGTLFLLCLLAGCAGANEPAPGRNGGPELNLTPAAPTPDPAIVSLGETIYADYCAECHGQNLEGEAEWQERNADGSFRAPPHDASGHTWHHSDRILRESILEGGARLNDLPGGGTSNMPAYAGTLGEQEIEAVLAYLKSSWPEEIRAIQWEQTVSDPGPEPEG
jgi:S-disulfanyl-L-cysteine oxidoreductase SoxD